MKIEIRTENSTLEAVKEKDKRTADIASSRSYYRKVIKPMLRAA